MIIKNEELITIYGGGFNFSGSFFNSIARCIEAILRTGRSLGTALRMVYSNRSC